MTIPCSEPYTPPMRGIVSHAFARVPGKAHARIETPPARPWPAAGLPGSAHPPRTPPRPPALAPGWPRARHLFPRLRKGAGPGPRAPPPARPRPAAGLPGSAPPPPTPAPRSTPLRSRLVGRARGIFSHAFAFARAPGKAHARILPMPSTHRVAARALARRLPDGAGEGGIEKLTNLKWTYKRRYAHASEFLVSLRG